MPEQIKNILWMAEELDFEMVSSQKPEAKQIMNKFLEATGVEGLNHRVYRTFR